MQVVLTTTSMWRAIHAWPHGSHHLLLSFQIFWFSSCSETRVFWKCNLIQSRLLIWLSTLWDSNLSWKVSSTIRESNKDFYIVYLVPALLNTNSHIRVISLPCLVMEISRSANQKIGKEVNEPKVSYIEARCLHHYLLVCNKFAMISISSQPRSWHIIDDWVKPESSKTVKPTKITHTSHFVIL